MKSAAPRQRRHLSPKPALLACLLFALGIATSALHAATTQKTTPYEAENALLVGGGTIVTEPRRASGDRYVDYANTIVGDYIEWTVSVENAGAAELLFRYDSADTASDRPLEIKVNGVVVAANHRFPSTRIGTQPVNCYGVTLPLNVTLNAGTNTVRATAVNNIGPNIDYITIKEILPLSGTIMTLYSGQNLSGTSATVDATHTIFSGATVPGGLNDQISSFVLSQGYMAVVADQANGLQSSLLYIANDGPLTVNILPTILDNAISYIRVIPWKNPGKKGVGGPPSIASIVNADWYYDWGRWASYGQVADGPQYAAMSWNGSGASPASIDDYLRMDQVNDLLSFNEPDGPNQSNIPDPLVAMALHAELQKAGLRLGSPACEEQDAFGANRWLPVFMSEVNAQGVRVDYICIHWYDWGSNPSVDTNPDPVAVANRLRAYLANVYAAYRLPIRITEFNANVNRPRAVQDGFLQEVLPFLDDIGYVERYAYFQWETQGDGTRPALFVDPTSGDLTSTGIIYRDHQSTPSYVPAGLPSPWQAADIGTTKAGASIYNGNFTVSGSGKFIGDVSDGLHYVYQPVSGNVTITAKVTSQIFRSTSSMAGVMIRESLASGSKQATMGLSWSEGAKFLARSTTNGSTATTTQTGIPRYPYWVRMVRQGNTFTAFRSPDGLAWTQTGAPTTIAMGSDVYVGMAVTSNNDGSFNDAIFKDVNVIASGPVSVTVPNVVGLSLATAESNIFAGLLALGNVTRAYSGTVAAGKVISQSLTAGSSVTAASAMDLVVSLGLGSPSPQTITTRDGTAGVSGHVARNDTGQFGIAQFHTKNIQDAAFNRKGYVRFDTSGVFPSEVGGASLDLVVSTIDSAIADVDQVINVYGLNDDALLDNWNPASTTWNNAPGNNTASRYEADLTKAQLLGTIVLDFNGDKAAPAGTKVSLSNQALADFLAADTNGKVTFILGRELNTASGANLLIAGDVHATYAAPRLAITYRNVAPAWLSDPVIGIAVAKNIAYGGTLAGKAIDYNAANTLTFSKGSGPAWLGVAPDGTLSGTPGNGDVGINLFTVSVSDGIAPAVEAQLSINVFAPTPYDIWTGNTFAGTFTDILPASDPDSDTLTNFMEFAFGTDPTASDATPLTWGGGPANAQPGVPTVVVEYPPGGGVKFTARFMRRTDHGQSGSVNYAWLFSSNLTDWESSANNPGWLTVPTVLGTDPSGQYQLVEIAYPFFLTTYRKARFFKVGVTPAP